MLQPEERDFNQSVLFGSDVTAAQIADAARRYPMMAEYQVLIVKEAQNVKQTEALEKYFKSPMPSTILVMCHKNGTVDGMALILHQGQHIHGEGGLHGGLGIEAV